MLVVDERTCYDLLVMEDAIPRVAESFRAIGAGPNVSVRGNMRDPERSVSGLLLGGYVAAADAVCLKLVGTFHGRTSQVITLFDTARGQPEAVVVGYYVCDFRTGAASAVATRALARPASRHLAVIGTGRQAVTQVQGALAVRPITALTVWNRTARNAATWIERMRKLLGPGGPEIRVADTPARACADADIVVVSTSAEEPVLHGEWLRPGTHVNAVGAGAPFHRELDASVFRRSDVVVVDSRELVVRAGDFARALEQGTVKAEQVAELGEVLGGARPGRRGEDEITLFKSVGHAANDVAVARLAVERARQAGRGVVAEIEPGGPPQEGSR